MSPEKPSWIRHLITFLIIFALGGFVIYRGGCGNGQQQEPVSAAARVVDVQIDRWPIKAEVADTEDLRRTGLSGRQNLPAGHGMLFVLPEPQVPAFWMKDATIDLSVAFIKADGTVVDIQQMEPESARLHSPSEAVKYALEVRRGWFEDRGLEPPFAVELPEQIPLPAQPEAE